MKRNPETDDGTDSEPLAKLTRRGALAALGGVAALGGGGTGAADVGGGPGSDELSHLARPVYEGPESDLPNAGVIGRRYTVTDSGGVYPQWTELRDNGSSWEPINFGAGSLNAEEGVIERGERNWNAERRSWRHRSLPSGQNWNRWGPDKPVISAADLPSPYDDFVADGHLLNVGGEIYIAFEASSTTDPAATWIAKLTVSYNNDGTISSVSVDTLDGGNPAISSSNGNAFPFMDRKGDTIYLTTSSGAVADEPNLYKISVSDFLDHNFASGISHVRGLVSPTGNTGDDGDWNASFHADAAWISRNGYDFLFVAAGRKTGEHYILGVWYTDDRENGELTLHPDAPIDFDPYNSTVSPFPLDLGEHIFMWSQAVDVRQITTLTRGEIGFTEPKKAMRVANTNQEQSNLHSLSVCRDGPAWLGAYDAQDSNNKYQIFLASQGVN